MTRGITGNTTGGLAHRRGSEPTARANLASTLSSFGILHGKAIVGRYFEGIMDLGFDGVVLNGVEAYRRWEFMTSIDPKASAMIEADEDEESGEP